MDVAAFCRQSHVLVVAGKGGVGKTTITAALARMAAAAGLSVLVLELEGKPGVPAAYGLPGSLGYEEAELAEGAGDADGRVRARRITPDDALLEYLADHGMKRVSKRLVSSGALDVVATAIPGIRDILVLGKVKSLERERAADLILVDAPATGHAMTFLSSAQGLLDAARSGPVRAQAADVVELLTDPERCQVALVTLPEEMPVNEVVEAAYQLEDRVGISLGPVIANACLPDEPALGHRPGGGGGRAPAWSSAPVELDALAARGRFRAQRRRLQEEQLARLAEELPLPQLRAPFLFSPSIGPAEVGHLAGVAGRGDRAAAVAAGDGAVTRRPCRRTAPGGAPRPAPGRRRRPAWPGTKRDRRVLRIGRRGQDHHLGRLRPGGGPPGPAGVRGHHRPGPAPGQRARRGRALQRGQPDRRAVAGRAVGPHARLQGHLRRPGPQARRHRPSRPRGSWPTACTRTCRGALSGTQEYMAMEKLYELAEEGELRHRRGRHAADAATPSTSSRRPAGSPGSSGHRLFQLLLMPTRAYLRAVSVAMQTLHAHPVEGGGGRDRPGRHHLLPGLRGDGGGLPGARRPHARPARPATPPPSCSSPRRAPTRSRRRGWFADRLARVGARRRRARGQPRLPGLPGHTAAPARAPAGSALAALEENLRGYQALNAREEAAFAELVAPAGPVAGRARAAARHRRPRRRRARPWSPTTCSAPGGRRWSGPRTPVSLAPCAPSSSPATPRPSGPRSPRWSASPTPTSSRSIRGHDVAPAVAEHTPDLVVVDLQMGNMGGMAVCLELRLEESYGKLPHVPVLMLLDRRPDVFLAKRSGAEGWLVKPLDPIRLRRATAALLGGGTYHDDSFQPVAGLARRGAGRARRPPAPPTPRLSRRRPGVFGRRRRSRRATTRRIAGRGAANGNAGDQERLILAALAELRDMTVREVMTPRVDVEGLAIPVHAADVARAVQRSGHSCFPVFDDDLDRAHRDPLRQRPVPRRVGDRAPATATANGEPDRPTPLDISRQIRQPFLVPESRLVLDVLADMRQNRRAFAVVVDEYGGVAGVLSVKDLLCGPGRRPARRVRPRRRARRHPGRPDPLARRRRRGGRRGGRDARHRAPRGRVRHLRRATSSTPWATSPTRASACVRDGWEFRVVEMDKRRIAKVVALAPPPRTDRRRRRRGRRPGLTPAAARPAPIGPVAAMGVASTGRRSPVVRRAPAAPGNRHSGL